MIDRAALKADLEADPKYAVHIAQGNDATIAEMWNEGKPEGEKIHHSDVSAALARFRVSAAHETTPPAHEE